MTSTTFDPDDYDLVTESSFDPSVYGLLDETDISYLIDSKVSEEVESWVEDNLEDAIESASVGASGVDYASDEFLDAVEKAVKATLAGITFTVQANVTQPEVHLDGHSSDEVVVAGV